MDTVSPGSLFAISENSLPGSTAAPSFSIMASTYVSICILRSVHLKSSLFLSAFMYMPSRTEIVVLTGRAFVTVESAAFKAFVSSIMCIYINLLLFCFFKLSTFVVYPHPLCSVSIYIIISSSSRIVKTVDKPHTALFWLKKRC